MRSLSRFIPRILIILCLGLILRPSMASDLLKSGNIQASKPSAQLTAQAMKAEEKEQPGNEALTAVIEMGRKNPRVAAALAKEEAYRETMSTDFSRQLGELARIWKAGSAENKDDVGRVRAVVERLQEDLTFINVFNKKARELSVDIVGYPIQSNKMGSFTEGGQEKKGIIGWAIDLLNSHGKSLLRGNVPEGYAITQASVTMLGENPISIFGSSKAPSLQMALMALLVHVKERKDFAELGTDLSQAMTYRGVAHTSNSQQIAALFSHLNPQCRLRQDNSLLAVHAGYIFGPLDCSSEATEAMGIPSDRRFTTAHLRFLAESARAEPGQVSTGTKDWLATPQGQFLAKKFSLVAIKDPLKDILAGHLWHRGSHTALIIGVLPDDKVVVTLGRNRLHPMEGVGIQRFPYTPDTNIFQVNEFGN